MDDRLPRYLKLRDEIAARIAALEWQPDQALPTEMELSYAYGVAIGTVRKAIDVLEQEGHLERFQGRGTFIRRASFDQSLFRFLDSSVRTDNGALRKAASSRVTCCPHPVRWPSHCG
ncbi:DNA-binding GntR family transcriptional regulator [Robbsia andropogonis]